MSVLLLFQIVVLEVAADMYPYIKEAKSSGVSLRCSDVGLDRWVDIQSSLGYPFHFGPKTRCVDRWEQKSFQEANLCLEGR